MIEGIVSLLCLSCSMMLLFQNATSARPRKVMIQGLVLFLLSLIISLSPLRVFSNLTLLLYLLLIYHWADPDVDFWHVLHNCLIVILIPTLFGFLSYFFLFKLLSPSVAYLVSSLCTLLFSILLFKFSVLRNILLIEINPFVTTVEVFGAFFLFLFFQFGQSRNMTFAYVISFILTLLVVYKLGRYFEAKKSLNKAYQTQLLYSRQLEELNDDLATFKHDYANLLLTLKRSIDSEDLQEIKAIFYNTLLPTKDLMLESKNNVAKYKHFANPEIKNLILLKEIEANAKGIKLDLEAVGTIQIRNIATADLVRMIAILLDNAIQATAQITQKNIAVTITKIAAELTFTVKNPTNGLQFDRKKMFQKEYSTAVDDPSRGIGLYSLQRLVEKNPNITLITEHLENQIIQSIIINDSTDFK